MLVVDDEAAVRWSVRSCLAPVGYDVLEAGLASEAIALLQSTSFDVAIIDLALPDSDGLAFLHRARVDPPDMQVIATVERADSARGVEAMKAGAFDYVTKPLSPDEVLVRVERALEVSRMHRELRQLRDTPPPVTSG